MKFAIRTLLVITFTLGATWLAAQVATKKGGIETRLAEALKHYPDADADKNGTLSVDEALKFLESHPELKALLATKSKTGGPKSSEPGEFSTPTSLGLPPGPRVFVCAHSFMIFTATMLPKMTEEAGIGYQDAGRQMIGGSRTLRHWEVPDDQNLAKKALSQGSVDVLTLSPAECDLIVAVASDVPASSAVPRPPSSSAAPSTKGDGRSASMARGWNCRATNTAC